MGGWMEVRVKYPGVPPLMPARPDWADTKTLAQTQSGRAAQPESGGRAPRTQKKWTIVLSSGERIQGAGGCPGPPTLTSAG